MSELWKKELRALLPMVCLIAALQAASFVYALMTGFVDMTEPKEESAEIGILIYRGLLAFLLGSSLLVGESNDGTLRFLHALPISRTRIFLAKIAAGLLVLELDIALDFALGLLTTFAGMQSTSEPISWAAEGVSFCMQSVLAVYLLSIAAVLSFTRRWYPLAAGFVVWGFLWMRITGVAWTGLLDPYELLTDAGEGAGLRFPWRHGATALGVSALCLNVAWGAFQWLGDHAEHAADRLTRGRLSAAARTIGVALLPLVWIGAIIYLFKTADFQTARGGEKSFATKETRRFDAVFREKDRERATKLIAKADEIHDQVTAYLRAEPVPGRIVADLGSRVLAHAAGQTNWTKVRVPLNQDASVEQLGSVLGHETVHVYISQLSAGAMDRNFDSTRFFHEGLATFLEMKFFATPAKARQMRQFAAASVARKNVPVELLMRNELLRRERDANLAYPLGMMFCRALEKVHGEQAAGDLLRVWSRPNLLETLRGPSLWRAAMQACGQDFDRVMAEYDADLDRALVEEAAFVGSIPHLEARLELVGSEIIVHPHYEGEAPGKLVCMLEGNVEPEIVLAQPDGTIHLKRSQYPGNKLRFALGWVMKEFPWPIYDLWREHDLE